MSVVTADQCYAEGEIPNVVTDGMGLINIELFPVRCSDINVIPTETASDQVKSFGEDINSKVDTIHTKWKGLQDHYQAPEASEVYSVMDPAQSSAEGVESKLSSASTALGTYAESLRTYRDQLRDLEYEALEFRQEALSGYTKTLVRPNTTRTEDIEWHEHGPAKERNDELVTEYATIYLNLVQAALDCSETIHELAGVETEPVELPEPEDLVDPENPHGWGAAPDYEPDCVEQAGQGLYNAGEGLVLGAGALVSYNPETGWGDWEYAGQSWYGMGDTLAGMGQMILYSPTLLTDHIPGIEDQGWYQGFQDHRYNRAESAAQFYHAFNIDLMDDDPFHMYRENGVEAFTEAAANGALFFVPVGGAAGGTARAGTAGARTAQVTANAARFTAEAIVPGGSRLVPTVRIFDAATPLGGRSPGVTPGGTTLNLSNSMHQALDTAQTQRPVTDGYYNRDAGQPGSGQSNAQQQGSGNSGDGGSNLNNQAGADGAGRGNENGSGSANQRDGSNSGDTSRTPSHSERQIDANGQSIAKRDIDPDARNFVTGNRETGGVSGPREYQAGDTTLNGYTIKGDPTPAQLETLRQADLDPDMPVRFNQETGRYELGHDVTVEFSPREGMTAQEMQQQLDLQQDGLNQLSAEEWAHNTWFFDENRGPGGFVEAETSKARTNYRNWRERNGLDTDGDALHGPDAVAGGRLESFDGVGGSRVNQHIGNQWVNNDRVAGMRREILEQLIDIPDDLLAHVHINVRLRAEG
ncbi:hypothetical protein HGQ17_08220 [Nesterenkonia sp. MY13]|uniref:Novel toxin 15 domain-containing protein n=1 Tax=Nesterenkonia sedimenti TaxID=1463632 RepID=A0A7X8YE94_9MICC|nr:hypothetical protein [Nesterenkonia sedimenti]NLS09982.1 hypothetical protein [Nesterenkonia sedimenti]